MAEIPQTGPDLRLIISPSYAAEAPRQASLNDGLYQASYSTKEIAARCDTISDELTLRKIEERKENTPEEYILAQIFLQLHVVETEQHIEYIGQVMESAKERIDQEKNDHNFMEFLDKVFDQLEAHSDSHISRVLDMLRQDINPDSEFGRALTAATRTYGAMLVIEDEKRTRLHVASPKQL